MFILRSIKHALNNNPLTYEGRKVLPILCLKLLIICQVNRNILENIKRSDLKSNLK